MDAIGHMSEAALTIVKYLPTYSFEGGRPHPANSAVLTADFQTPPIVPNLPKASTHQTDVADTIRTR